MRLSHEYFFYDALKSGDLYNLDKSCFEIVYGGLRMLLAHNEEFFPSHKRLMEYAARLKHKPDGIIALAKAVHEKKDGDSATTFVNVILSFTDWGFDTTKGYGPVYVKGLEQTWLNSEDNVYEM
jgi:hypothetical protein